MCVMRANDICEMDFYAEIDGNLARMALNLRTRFNEKFHWNYWRSHVGLYR